MQFNSYLFILLFVPVTLTGYFALSRRALRQNTLLTLPNLFLLAMSLWFYGYFNPVYLLLICGSIVVNFCLGKCLNGDWRNTSPSKLLLTFGILFNAGLIFYFKYYDFFIDNLNAAFHTDFNLKHLLLPLGISFFTFQQISFLVDSYRKETCGYGFLEYALFVTFFPQLVAGPIVLHSELVPQFRDRSKRTPDYDNLATGLMMFTLGLAKKVLIADVLGQCVTWGFAHAESASAFDALFVMFSYTFQIYFDFSGYSDMATGLARMFNFTIPQNFNSPYQATSITDFWGRWHMTLTRFLRQYIYFPLGGSRGKVVQSLPSVEKHGSHGLTRGQVHLSDSSDDTLRQTGKSDSVPDPMSGHRITLFLTCRNILIVFLVSGLWHGANWTFVLWGLLHGLCEVAERLWKPDRGPGTLSDSSHNTLRQTGKSDSVPDPLSDMPGDSPHTPGMTGKVLRWSLTFFIVNILWLLFRADSVAQWGTLLGRLFSGDWYLHEDAVRGFKVPGLVSAIYSTGMWFPQRKIYGACGLLFLGFCLTVCLFCKNNYQRHYTMTKRSLAWTCGLLLLCLLSLSTVSVFLYFNF